MKRDSLNPSCWHVKNKEKREWSSHWQLSSCKTRRFLHKYLFLFLFCIVSSFFLFSLFFLRYFIFAENFKNNCFSRWYLAVSCCPIDPRSLANRININIMICDSCERIVLGFTFSLPTSSINSCNLFVSCIVIGWNFCNCFMILLVVPVPSSFWLHLASTDSYTTFAKRTRPGLTKKIKREENDQWHQQQRAIVS